MPQMVAVQLLAAEAATGEQVCTPTGPVVSPAVHVVVVQLLPALAPEPVQVCTGTLVVLLVEQLLEV